MGSVCDLPPHRCSTGFMSGIWLDHSNVFSHTSIAIPSLAHSDQINQLMSSTWLFTRLFAALKIQRTIFHFCNDGASWAPGSVQNFRNGFMSLPRSLPWHKLIKDIYREFLELHDCMVLVRQTCTANYALLNRKHLKMFVLEAVQDKQDTAKPNLRSLNFNWSEYSSKLFFFLNVFVFWVSNRFFRKS